MTKYACPIAALGKKLKRRTLKRQDWDTVRRELRRRDSAMHQDARARLALVIDRHAPTLYDGDQLALRALFVERHAGQLGRTRAACHMLRVSNGRPGLNIAYARAAFPLKGYFHVMPKAKLPADRSAS